MLEAEARGAAIMAIVRLKEGHTGATHMSHQQNTGRGRTAFTTDPEAARKADAAAEAESDPQVLSTLITSS
ncbi:unnamed protein product [Boreogadus saida]